MLNIVPRWPAWPLFAQITALLMLCVLAVQAISVLVLFLTPQPQPEFYRLDDVARALSGAKLGGGEAGLRVAIRATPPDNPVEDPWESVLRDQLARRLAVPRKNVRVVLWPGEDPPPLPLSGVMQTSIRRGDGGTTSPADVSNYLIAPFEVALRGTNGTWRLAGRDGGALYEAWRWRLLLWLVVSALVTLMFGFFFARKAAAPLAAFASAVRRFGRDTHAPPLVMQGPRELRIAVEAFNDMQEQLRRLVESRTRTIAAIAHDLRTPLTRLAFRLEAAPDLLRSRTASDIAEMDAMIESVLAFVRDGSRSARIRVELASLVESAAVEFVEIGADLTFDEFVPAYVEADPLALRAAVSNLMSNAIKYGGSAHVHILVEGDRADVVVEDHGPGIPDEELERVFEPFYRLEASRSRSTGGSGLGLALVRATAEAHGGHACLDNREQGGLRATISLPLQSGHHQ